MDILRKIFSTSRIVLFYSNNFDCSQPNGKLFYPLSEMIGIRIFSQYHCIILPENLINEKFFILCVWIMMKIFNSDFNRMTSGFD